MLWSLQNIPLLSRSSILSSQMSQKSDKKISSIRSVDH